MCCLYVVSILSVCCQYVVCMLSVCSLYIVCMLSVLLSVCCLYIVCICMLSVLLSVGVLVQSAGPETFPTAPDKKRQLDRQSQHTDNILTCIKILDKLQKRSYCS